MIFAPPYDSEEEAMEYGFRKFGGNFEVSPLLTKDRAEATAAIKRAIFERTSNLDVALRRARHTMPKESE